MRQFTWDDTGALLVAVGVGLMAYAWTEHANWVQFSLGLNGDGPVLFAIGAAVSTAGLLFSRQ